MFLKSQRARASILILLFDLFSKWEELHLSKQHPRIKREKKTIEKLKRRLVDVIKKHEKQRKLYERRARAYEKWTKRHIDRYNDFADLVVKYHKAIEENNALTLRLDNEIERYNRKIEEVNELQPRVR